MTRPFPVVLVLTFVRIAAFLVHPFVIQCILVHRDSESWREFLYR